MKPMRFWIFGLMLIPGLLVNAQKKTSITGTIVEGREYLDTIHIAFTSDTLDASISSSQWTTSPTNIIRKIDRVDGSHVNVMFNSTLGDYDANQRVIITINRNAFNPNLGGDVKDTTYFIARTESITLKSNNIQERHEAGDSIVVYVHHDTLKTINPVNWHLTGLPKGIGINQVIKVSDTIAHIILNGSCLDYDVNKTPTLTVSDSAFRHNTSPTSLSANSGVTFVAYDDQEKISITGSAKEGSEGDSSITVKITGGKFTNPLNGSWIPINRPVGVGYGSPVRVNDSTVRIPLTGSSTMDYDVDKTNLTLTVPKNSIVDTLGALNPVLTASTGFTFVANDDQEIISITGSAKEGFESDSVVKVSITGGQFTNPLSGTWILTNLPSGVTQGSVTRLDNTHAKIALQGKRTVDYDVDKTNLSLTVPKASIVDTLGAAPVLTANSGFKFIANDDQETISISGSAREGFESDSVVKVTIHGGTFNDPLTGSWTLSNLPSGVFQGTVLRIDNTHVNITLVGKSDKDYDVNKTNLGISVPSSSIMDPAGILSPVLTADSGFTFIANNDPEIIEITGYAKEGFESDSVVHVSISGGQFTNPLSGTWKLTNLPSGVTMGTVSRIDNTHASITLVGKSDRDYDVSKTNLTLTVPKASTIDTLGAVSTLTASTGFTFIANDDPEVITISGVAKEGSESDSLVKVTISGGQFSNPLSGTWTLSNLPSGVTMGTVSRIDSTHATISLTGTSNRDYDVNKTNLTLTVPKASTIDSLGTPASLTANTGFVFQANDDPEVISISGYAKEGFESDSVVHVAISGGQFADPLSGSWTLANQPVGVSIGTVTRVDNTHATIALVGKRTVDYDENITNLSVTVPITSIVDAAGSAPTLTANSGFTFIAYDDPEVIAISGSARESHESDSLVKVTITGGTFTNPLTGGWKLDNLPSGVTIGTVTRKDNTHATIALVGKRNVDYDQNIYNLTLTVPKSSIADTNGLPSTLTASTGFIFMTNDDQEVLHISGTATEGSENGKTVNVYLQGGTFSTSLNPSFWILSNTPAGVSKGSVTRTSDTTAIVTLNGNSSLDYDTDITNLTLSIPQLDVMDPYGSLPSILSANSGFTFHAIFEDPTFATDDLGKMPEGSQNGKKIVLTVQQDTFNLVNVDTTHLRINNQPLGVYIASAGYLNPNQVEIVLKGNSIVDFDSAKTSKITLNPGILKQHAPNTYVTNYLFPANNDAEVLSVSWANNPGTRGREEFLNKDTLLVRITGGTFVSSTLSSSVSISGTATSYGVSKKDVIYVNPGLFKLTLNWDSTDFDNNLGLRVNLTTAGYKDPYPGNAILSADTVLTATNDPEILSSVFSSSRGTFGVERKIKGEIIHVGITGGTFRFSPDHVTNHVTLSGTAVTDAHIALGSLQNISRYGFDLVLDWDGTDYDVNKTLIISLDTSAYRDGVLPLNSSITLPATVESVNLSPLTIVEANLNTGNASIILSLHGASWKAADGGGSYYKNATIDTLFNSFRLVYASPSQVSWANTQLSKLKTQMKSNAAGPGLNDANYTAVLTDDSTLTLSIPAVADFSINEPTTFGVSIPKLLVTGTNGNPVPPPDFKVIESPRIGGILFGDNQICADGTKANMSVILTGTPPWSLVISKDSVTVLRANNIMTSPYTFKVTAPGYYDIDSLSDHYFSIGRGDVKLSGFINLKVNPLPSGTSIVGLNAKYAVSGAPISLSAAPDNSGNFSGPFVDNYNRKFYPSVIGLYHIIYKYTDANQCSNFDTATVEVIDANTTIKFSPQRIGDVYCNYEKDVVITASGYSTINNEPRNFLRGALRNAIDSISPDTIILHPYLLPDSIRLANEGFSLTIDFQFMVGPDLFQSSKTIKIENPPTIWTNISDGEKFCKGSGILPTQLIGYNGKFFQLGDGVEQTAGGYAFNPNSVNAGLHNIIYRWTGSSDAECVSDTTVKVQVFDVPLLGFSIMDSCIYPAGDSTYFVNLTPLVDTAKVASWNWNFGDKYDPEFNSSDQFNPVHVYMWKQGDKTDYTTASGTKAVTLTSINKPAYNACQTSITKEIDLGMIPSSAGFSWDNECFEKNQLIRFTRLTGSGSESDATDKTFKWRFYKPGSAEYDSLSGSPVSFGFDSLASYKVDLVYTTNFGCSFTRTDTLNLRPTVLIQDHYYNDFEHGNAGWFAAATSVANSWRLGTPDNSGLTAASSGQFAWYTKISNRREPEKSYVTSPCFDFSNLKNPMVNMDIWRSFSNEQDGAMLQYTTSPGDTLWNTLGTTNEAVNWYNKFQILGLPDAKTIGWSGDVPDPGWVTARHWLTSDLRGKPHVRFRVVYGSNGTSLGQNEGFAFDNFWIGEKRRRVLIEHFTSSGESSNLAANALVDQIQDQNPVGAVDIQYHLNLDGNDPIYDVNKDDPNSRLFFYGIQQTPYAFMDGGSAGTYTFSASSKPNQSDLDNRSLSDPSFEINLQTSISSQVLTVHAVIRARIALPKNLLTVQTVAVEKEISGVTGMGNAVFHNVVRKLIPNASGTIFNRAWNAGDSTALDLSWNIANVTDPTQLRVVMFIQDVNNKEVYQAVTNDTTTIPTSVDPTHLAEVNDFHLYPNPAGSKAYVAFHDVLSKESTLYLMDITGRMVKTLKLQPGEQYIELDVSALPSGVYLVRTEQEGSKVRRLIVQHH